MCQLLPHILYTFLVSIPNILNFCLQLHFQSLPDPPVHFLCLCLSPIFELQRPELLNLAPEPTHLGLKPRIPPLQARNLFLCFLLDLVHILEYDLQLGVGDPRAPILRRPAGAVLARVAGVLLGGREGALGVELLPGQQGFLIGLHLCYCYC